MTIARTESEYLISSNKEKCKKLLETKSLSEEELMDFFVSLHLVMEISLNAFFRNLSLMQIQKSVNKLEIAKNIDSINFIDKTILFVYNYSYDFSGDLSAADQYHSIINKLKDFSSVRNKLLHGHSISTLYCESGEQQSDAKKMLTDKKLQHQIKLFKDIFEGLRFYFDHVKSSLTPSGKESFKKAYLDDSFLIIQ